MTKIVTRPSQCIPYRLAILLAGLTPRGKGAIPRWVGRVAARWINDSLVTRHGALLPIIPGALDVFVSMANQDSSWDYWVLRAVDRLLRDGGVFYDVGANVGYLSVELAHKRKQDGVTVYAFEPNEELVDGMRRALELNDLPNLRILDVAVGSERGEIEFAIMPHSIHSSAIKGVDGAKRVIRVRQESIDNLVESGAIPWPDVIKIDVEGYEFSVLRGARGTIRRYKPAVIFEISDNTGKIIESFGEFGFYFEEIGGYRICDLRGDEVDLNQLRLEAGTHRDLVALPEHWWNADAV